MIIKNANVFTSDHRFVQGDVTVTGDRFSVVLENRMVTDRWWTLPDYT